jgi:hypothetical protein
LKITRNSLVFHSCKWSPSCFLNQQYIWIMLFSQNHFHQQCKPSLLQDED